MKEIQGKCVFCHEKILNGEEYVSCQLLSRQEVGEKPTIYDLTIPPATSVLLFLLHLAHMVSLYVLRKTHVLVMKSPLQF